MKRMLASVQRIIKLEAIPKADAIEKATVMGWELVVKRGEFKEGDLVVFCEVDSVLPIRPWSEFLVDRKYRVKTIKLRGQISQGIAFPLTIIPQYGGVDEYKEGEDVTEVLGVIRYENPEEQEEVTVIKKGRIVNFISWLLWKLGLRRSKRVYKGFPIDVPKTDETRIQSCPEELEKLLGRDIYITEKLDGTSVTYFIRGDEFGICSRNCRIKNAEIGGGKYVEVSRKYNLEEKFKGLPKTWVDGVAIQGEIVGPGVNGNRLCLKELDFYVFNIYDIGERKYLSSNSTREFCRVLGIKMVPIVFEDKVLKGVDVDNMTQISKGFSALSKSELREGIVVRTTDGGPRVSFKVVNPDYLLAHGI